MRLLGAIVENTPRSKCCGRARVWPPQLGARKVKDVKVVKSRMIATLWRTEVQEEPHAAIGAGGKERTIFLFSPAHRGRG